MFANEACGLRDAQEWLAGGIDCYTGLAATGIRVQKVGDGDTALFVQAGIRAKVLVQSTHDLAPGFGRQQPRREGDVA